MTGSRQFVELEKYEGDDDREMKNLLQFTADEHAW